MYIIDPLPLFCSTFRCAIISYPCSANSFLYIGLEIFFGKTSHTPIMSGLCSSTMNLNSLILFVNVSAFKERQINLFFVCDLWCLFCGLFLWVSLFICPFLEISLFLVARGGGGGLSLWSPILGNFGTSLWRCLLVLLFYPFLPWSCHSKRYISPYGLRLPSGFYNFP